MKTITTPVSEVMTARPVCARAETPVKEIAAMLAREGISAVAVVDHAGTLVGVVSEKDLLPMVRGGRFRWWRRRDARKAGARSAREVMTSPVVTVAADETVSEAAAKLDKTGLRRLFVVEDGRPAGVVARRDVLRALTRPDPEIERDVVTGVLYETLHLGPDRARAMVRAGVVTVAGRVERRSEIAPVTRLIEAVPGVVAVCNGLDYVWDDVA
ncbi:MULTISPECIES: CBS domain-containing protein [Amycolatopsis]|uniref:CBS domain-containing protein n=1 Tax=Amycolatopsis TaxID=1813 RepID=UPI0010703C35|nr:MULTISPECIES: CBS domain-containing protein [Amycolatopsis]MCG3754133.1 CBS domain-containing protein [Amycolatopsis sp. Poz14]